MCVLRCGKGFDECVAECIERRCEDLFKPGKKAWRRYKDCCRSCEEYCQQIWCDEIDIY